MMKMTKLQNWVHLEPLLSSKQEPSEQSTVNYSTGSCHLRCSQNRHFSLLVLEQYTSCCSQSLVFCLCGLECKNLAVSGHVLQSDGSGSKVAHASFGRRPSATKDVQEVGVIRQKLAKVRFEFGG